MAHNHLGFPEEWHIITSGFALGDYCAIPQVSKIAKIPWIWAITLAQVTANNGGFLIELVYNNSLVGFLDEYNHLYYPAMLC